IVHPQLLRSHGSGRAAVPRWRDLQVRTDALRRRRRDRVHVYRIGKRGFRRVAALRTGNHRRSCHRDRHRHEGDGLRGARVQARGCPLLRHRNRQPQRHLLRERLGPKHT
ncbi:unnamed protein product, partial [Ectocarpus fasciculatus]